MPGKFLIRALLFLVIVCSVLAVIFVGIRGWLRNSIEARLDRTTTQVVIGHSHTECALNDTLIPAFENLSRSGESYFYSLLKTRLVLEQNPQLETIFISGSANLFTTALDGWIWNTSYVSRSYEWFFPYCTLSDHWLLAQHNPAGWQNALANGLRQNAYALQAYPEIDYRHRLGAYHSLSAVLPDFPPNTWPTVTPNQSQDTLSETGIDYFRQLVDLCKAHGTTPVVVRVPAHSNYRHWNIAKDVDALLQTAFPTLEVLDFSAFPLSSADYADTEHLNAIGAQRFSEWFAQLLTDGLLEAKNKQKFIDAHLPAPRDTTVLEY